MKPTAHNPKTRNPPMKTTNQTLAQHTPGPWELHGLAVYASPEKRSFGGPAREYLRPVCCMEVVEGGDHPDYKNDPTTRNVRLPGDAEAEANARLIAAAPDLLAALEDIIRLTETTDIWLPISWKDDARAAIARANGGAA